MAKDGLVHDIKNVKEKAFALLNELHAECLKENQNEPLETLFEPDLSASLSSNEIQLLVLNLNNLKIKRREGKIEYKLTEGRKSPDKINKKVAMEYSKLNECIQLAIAEVSEVLDNYKKERTDGCS
jgi:hypothetical protein